MRRLTSEYGIVVALLLLCVYYSVVTMADQPATGPDAGTRAAASLTGTSATRVLIAGTDTEADRAFVAAAAESLRSRGITVAARVSGQPPDVRQALEETAARGEPLTDLLCSPAAAVWPVFDEIGKRFPVHAKAKLHVPQGYRWPNFLKRENLLNIANQISVIAIVAIGMTLVIITGGIDLSVGSLLALASVVCTILIRDRFGAENAGSLGMTVSSFMAIALCGFVGLSSGIMISRFRIPPFIVTLAVLLVGSGLSFTFAHGQSIYQVPDTFVRLGRGADIGGIPNAAMMMIILYALAHLVMTRSRFGRYVIAVGANPEGARLSGVPIGAVVVSVYVLSGLLAGLGGIVMASQLKSGSPTYGQMYELYVIAAAVVGGASLAGGKGNVLATLLGALVIAVIQNGMNLTNVESYTQKVVLGLVILGAVVLDRSRSAKPTSVLGT